MHLFHSDFAKPWAPMASPRILMKTIHSSLAASVFAALSLSAHALTLPVSEDTSTTTNIKLAKAAGMAKTLPVTAVRSALIRFEVSAFSNSIDSAQVSRARLLLFVGKVTKPGDLTLRAVTQDWSEVFAAPLVVPTFGPNLAPIPAATVVAKQFVIVDVTAQVKAWLAAPASDFGFALTATGTTNVLLGAKEGSGTGYPAMLEIDYSDPLAAGSVTGAQLASNLTLGGTTTGTFAGDGSGLTNVTIANTLPDGSVTNAKLANSSLTINAGNGLTGGGSVVLGGNVALSLGSNLSLSGTTLLPAGTAAVAPLKFLSGVTLATPAFGAMEFDGSNLFITINNAVPARKTLAFTDTAISANQIAHGTITGAMLAGSIDVTTLNTGVVSNAEFNFLDGVTTGIQGQFDTLTTNLATTNTNITNLTTTVNGKVSKAGDTMTGALTLPANGLTVGTTQLAAANGRIGIGTSAPSTMLHVKTESGVTNSVDFALKLENNDFGDTTTGLLFSVEGGSLDYAKAGIAFQRTNTFARGKLHILQNTVSDTNSVTLADSVMTFDNAKVGIGTTTPAAGLHVQVDASGAGVARLDNKNPTGFSGLYFHENGTYRANIGYVNSGPGSLFGAPGTMQLGGAADLVFTCEPSGSFFERMRIVASTGSVGIGTSTPDPSFPLTLKGMDSGNGDSGVLMLRNTFNTPEWHLTVRNGGHLDFSESTLSDNRLFLQAGGNVGIGTKTPGFKLDVNGGIRCIGAVNTASDARFKIDLQPLPGALEQVQRLHGVSFDWNRAAFPGKGFDDRRQLGFIAQEVREVLPELVTTDADGYLSVGYTALIPVLTEAIKQLRAEKDAEITRLNAKLEAAEARLERIERALQGAPVRTTRASLDRN